MVNSNSIVVLTLGASEVQVYKEDIEAHNWNLNINSEATPKRFELRSPDSDFVVNLKANRSYKGRYILFSPRFDGEVILNNFNHLELLIRFPLIDPLFEQILDNKDIMHIVIVYTDQPEDVADDYRRNDTVSYASILKEYIKRKYKNLQEVEFIDIPITANVSDVDANYKLFAKGFSKIFGNQETLHEIFLLPQGGIDQINHALTLQLIQHYKNRVRLLQVPECGTIKELNFTNLFLHDLLKQQIISLAECGEYLGASRLLTPYVFGNKRYSNLENLLLFAHFRKIFIYKEAVKKTKNAYSGNIQNLVEDFCNKFVSNDDLILEFNDKESAVFDVRERFYVADFYWAREDYTQFVLSFQIFYEFLVNNYLSVHFDVDLVISNHKEGKRLLNLLCKNNSSIVDNIINKFNENLRKDGEPVTRETLTVSFPFLALAAYFYANENGHTRVFSILSWLSSINSVIKGGSGIDSLRNNIAHKGEGVTKDRLSGVLTLKKTQNGKNWGSLIDDLRVNLDIKGNPYFEINTLVETFLGNS